MKHYDWDNILQYMDDELLEEALAPAAGKKTKARQGKRVYRTLLIAAIIASFMVTAAYAAGLLDFRALLMDKTVEIDGQEFSRISLTQPQAVPEEPETAGAQENALKDADKLEEIAAKYGLKLRKGHQLLWSSETTGMSGAGFITNQQLAEKTAEIGCAGNIFYETPVGFDKVYWYDEGTFCVSYYVDLPSSGERVTCYGYNSMYSTLSSGKEVINWERNLDAFTQRSHTAPDGTELSILSNGRDAYIYVYLENSFFAMHVHSEEGVTEEDMNYIADTLKYSLIGQG